jgi:hypothetical protein
MVARMPHAAEQPAAFALRQADISTPVDYAGR